MRKWSDVLTIVSGKNQKSVINPNGKYPIYGSGGIIGYADDYLCEPGTTVIGRKGTINSPIFVDGRFWNVDTAFGITPGKDLIPKFLYYFCLLYNFKGLDKSTTIPSLSKRDLFGIEMPIPYLSKQQQIVTHLDELFSDLDKAVEILRVIKRQLVVYRQAVLKSAFDRFRDINKKMQFWRIDEIAKVETGATPLTSNPDYYGGHIPWITSSSLNKEFIKEPSKYITELAIQETNCKVFEPHTIVVAMYGEGKTRGKCSELLIRAATNQAIAAISILDTNVIDKSFLKWYLTLNYYNLRRRASGGVQPNLNLSTIKSIKVPCVSISDQEKIVSLIEKQMDANNHVLNNVDDLFEQTECLKLSILKAVFAESLK